MPRWPPSTSSAPSCTASGTTPSHQILIAQIARLSRDGPLVEAMERHVHLQLEQEVRTKLLAMSAATIDRALRDIRRQAGTAMRRRSAPWAAIRRSVPVRTFDGWDDPPPGFVEADLVAHSGPVARGSFVQNLVLTHIPPGWTECAPLLVREQRLLTEGLGELRKLLPFP